ncbi:hypothetical protein J7438_06935 [Thalassotalea sp. G20_0]|uniref:hypothetical protein n=1 Tax=Thalassotalea sp. G20_0 TaxID=2821093 RepID=UPI001AD97469|nr:hypothetical protein [Thalassotalea sp. G20_0]MBO9493819.1 hypothetical protein [Thalassotalea sp. G20_0]
MNKYTRYFKVTSGALIEAVKECRSTNDAANKEYVALLNKLGAEETYYVVGHRLVAMTFKNSPDQRIYKRNKNTNDGWYPKKNCKEGKEIAQAIESIKTQSVDDCLKAVGLYSGPRIIQGGYAYSATLVVIPSEPMELYVTVPWYDEDPEVIEQYKKDKDARKRSSMSLDALLWKPPSEMTEVKEWEVKKVIQEWNDSLKEVDAA